MSSVMSFCFICKEKSFDYTTPCGHNFHMKCFEPWFKRNKFCPYCRKAIIPIKKILKSLSKTCERCGNGPSNFVTRCHHFIHTKNCTSKKIPYRKCPVCYKRISSNQRTEILNSQHVWSNKELEVDMPLSFLELAKILCENEQLMSNMSFNYIIKRLLDTGFYIDQRVKSPEFRLINCACKGNNVAAIKELTLLGSNLNTDIYYSFSPVNYAVESNNLDLLNFLVENGADIKTFPDKLLYTALADLNEDGRMFERLVEMGQDPKKYEYDGMNLLMMAVQTEYYNAVVKLIDVYGLNVNEVNMFSYSAFLYAKNTKDSRIIDFLVERGADTKHVTDFNHNAFLLACCEYSPWSSDQIELTKKLFDIIEPDLNAEDKYGETALDYAASRGNLEIFNFLVKKGSDNRRRNRDGSYPINYAILNGHDNIVERIFELGAPLTDLTQNSIMPPLHFLANNCPYQSTLRRAVQKLSELGVDFSSRDLRAAKRNLEFMEILVNECGLDINDKDYDLRRPIDLAYDERATSWLLKHGSKPRQSNTKFTCCLA